MSVGVSPLPCESTRGARDPELLCEASGVTTQPSGQRRAFEPHMWRPLRRSVVSNRAISGSPHVLYRIKCLDSAGVTLDVFIEDRPCGVRRAVIAHKNLKRVPAALVENAIERAGDVARVVESGDQNTHAERTAVSRFRCHSHAPARHESATGALAMRVVLRAPSSTPVHGSQHVE